MLSWLQQVPTHSSLLEQIDSVLKRCFQVCRVGWEIAAHPDQGASGSLTLEAEAQQLLLGALDGLNAPL